MSSVLSEQISTRRTCRLKNATRIRIRELIDANLTALDRAVSFLEKNDIRLYRVTSNLVPFASHPVNAVRWWEEFASRFAAVGRRLRALDVRISAHPGQFTVLNSPNDDTVRASVAELEYHARLLDLFATGPSSKIVLHIGGLCKTSEAAAMDRFVAVASGLSERVRRRLVIENDDRLFDAEEVLAVAERISVPVVFDWLHHQANPCRMPLAEVLPAIFATWKPHDGRPKVHLSSQAADSPAGAHADFIDPGDAVAFFTELPDRPYDCMLEAKQKDRALLKLRTDLAARGIVEGDRRGEGRSRKREEGGPAPIPL